MLGWWERFWGKGLGMTPVVGQEPREFVSRRNFLRVGSAGVVGLSLAEHLALAQANAAQHRHAIVIMMTGGPSQLDTFDLKPEAPAAIRGPMKAISTAIPGVQLSEALPQLAQRLDRCVLLRSLHHDAAPIHETGQQYLQTGRLASRNVHYPHFGAIVAQHWGWNSPLANVILPRAVRETGIHSASGQSAGCLGPAWEPTALHAAPHEEPEAVRRMYGETDFGRLLLQARQQVEVGARCVTVNLFDTLKDQRTWDCHGEAGCGPSTLCDYRDTLVPQFDRALSGMLDDLQARGLLDSTLVIATGEMGRSPRVNEYGGRDHWVGCWSGLVAGGGIAGRTVLGASDATASEPIELPITPDQIAATLLAWFGVDGRSHVLPGQGPQAFLAAAPLYQLWGSTAV